MEQFICIFGASSTQGFYDSQGGGWCDRLKTYLFDKTCRSDDYFETFNLGISGNTTRDLLTRLDSECAARSPSVIIISIGDNDSALGVPINEFEENLNELIEIAQGHADKILLLGCKNVNESLTNPVVWDENCFYKNDKIAQYDAALKKVAQNKKIEYLHIFNLLNMNDLEDGLHPNSLGHTKIFAAVRDFLEKKHWI